MEYICVCADNCYKGSRSEWQKTFEKMAEREGRVRSRQGSIWSFSEENGYTGRRGSLVKFTTGIFARKGSVVSVSSGTPAAIGVIGEKEVDLM